jgi:anti-anti-sigma factor
MGRPDSFDEILRALNLEEAPRIALKSREREWRTLLAAFPPPPVASINPYKVLHLQRGEVGEGWDFEAHLPPYVRRDVDAELDALLRRDQPLFLLLAGPSKCGKSRTAFEALARNLGERVLLLPERLDDIRRVLEALPGLVENWPRPILWLDDVHEHLRAQSLSSGQLRQALDDGVVVVATIWDNKLMSLGGLGPTAPTTGLDTSTLRAAREVLRHARVVRLEGTVSAAERERAETLYPHLSFDAGLGETFVARGLLLQRFDNGSRELKALVWALVDCTRAGLLDGTPLSVLRRVMPAYLERADPGAWITSVEVERLLTEGLMQGMEPIGVHQRLIIHTGDDSFEVYDPLRYHVEQSADRSLPLPPVLWQAVLEVPGNGVNWVVAGLTAWQTGDYRVAEEAYRTGMVRGNAAAACSLGVLLETVDDLDGAEAAYQTAVDLGDHNAAYHLALLRGEASAVESAGQPRVEGALAVAVHERRGVTVLELKGTLTLGGGYQALHAVTHREIDRGKERFLLHLRAVSAIDPAGVGALVGALTAAVHRGRTLRLCCVPSEIVETLTRYGLIRIFEVYADDDVGLSSFV